MITPREVLLSVIVVNYNTKDLTLACLQSLYDQTEHEGLEVLVVDNASHDGSAEAISASFPQAILIKSAANLGFARANNLASQQAKGKYVLLLNSDTVVLNRGVSRLLEFAQANPGARIWGGRTVFADMSLNPTCCWRFMSLWSLFCQATGLSRVLHSVDFFNREAFGSWQRDTRRTVDFVSGCFLMIERELWEKLGGFDLQFFMYAEEADLCYRARAHGASPLFTPEATIIHYGGKSERQKAEKLIRLLSGKMTFILKHWPRPAVQTGRSILLLHCLLRATAETFRRRPERPWGTVLSKRKTWLAGYPPLMKA